MEIHFKNLEIHITAEKKKKNQWLCFLSASISKTNEELRPMHIYRQYLTLQFHLPHLIMLGICLFFLVLGWKKEKDKKVGSQQRKETCDTLEILFCVQQNV